MLRVGYHKHFKKDFQKLQSSIQQAFRVRFLEFISNPRSPLLHDHFLKGAMKGKKAFSVTGDIRAIYRYVDKDRIIFLRIGSHNQVY